MNSSDSMRSNPSSIRRLSQVNRHLSASSTSSSSTTTSSPPSRRTPRSVAPSSESFVYWLPFQSRWSDNDQYSHFNNTIYSQYFDSITNEFLINQCGMNSSPELEEDPIGLIVHSETNFNSQLSFPEPVLCGLSIRELSNRKIVWNLGLFKAEYYNNSPLEEEGKRGIQFGNRNLRIARIKTGKEEEEEEEVRAAAWGSMTHVFVERGREKNKVVESLPIRWQTKLKTLIINNNNEEIGE
ncbi:hypothetical protein JCM3765_001329 [Sporobolomyces pararoseus]